MILLAACCFYAVREPATVAAMMMTTSTARIARRQKADLRIPHIWALWTERLLESSLLIHLALVLLTEVVGAIG